MEGVRQAVVVNLGGRRHRITFQLFVNLSLFFNPLYPLSIDTSHQQHHRNPSSMMRRRRAVLMACDGSHDS